MKYTLCIAITLLTTNFGVLADNEMEKEPGLFSGKKGAFTLLKTDNLKPEEQVKEQTQNQASTPQSNVKSTAHELSQKEDFTLFKNWKQHKDNNTAEYQEFLLWLEYKKINQ
jgi:hypothetical protein